MDDYQNPQEGKTYISPRLDEFGDSDRKVRIVSKVIESPVSYAFARIKDEVVLRHKEGAKSRITAKFFEDNRGISVLSIQGYTVATEKPHNAGFSFVGEEIGKLLESIRNIQSLNLDNPSRVNISDEELNRIFCLISKLKACFMKTKSCLLKLSNQKSLLKTLLRLAIEKSSWMFMGNS